MIQIFWYSRKVSTREQSKQNDNWSVICFTKKRNQNVLFYCVDGRYTARLHLVVHVSPELLGTLILVRKYFFLDIIIQIVFQFYCSMLIIYKNFLKENSKFFLNWINLFLQSLESYIKKILENWLFKFWKLLPNLWNCKSSQLVGNMITWEKSEPRTKKKIKNKKIKNFELYPRFKSVLGRLHFPLH